MSTIMELMLKIDNRNAHFFYHKDTKVFDRYPVSSVQLFNILRRSEYVHAFMEGLHAFHLYDDFEMACWEIYEQMFLDWAEKKGLLSILRR